ncbi:MAG: VCBS repeat-containing protein [Acidobacteriota bacterium]
MWARGVLVVALVAIVAESSWAEVSLVGRTDLDEVGAGATAVLAADFFNATSTPPGTPDLDLAVLISGSNTIVLLQNDGSGRFSVCPTCTITAEEMGTQSTLGNDPADFTVADLDGDTLQDDLVGVNQESARFFALANGPGGWAPTDMDANSGSGSAIALEDWDGDMMPDFFACTTNGAVRTAGRSGAGTFSDVNVFLPAGATVGAQTDIAIGDFIALSPGVDDDLPDILTVDNQNRQLVIWPGDLFPFSVRNDALRLIPVMAGGSVQTPASVVTRDFDADGSPDVLLLTEEGYLLFYPSDLAAGLGAPTETDVIGFLSAGADRLPTRFSSMVLADVVNRVGGGPDGVDDLIISDAGDPTSEEGFNWLWILPGITMSPTPRFDVVGQVHYAAADLGTQLHRSLAVANLDADPAPDIALVNFDSTRGLSLFRNTAGTFDAGRSYAAGLTNPSNLAVRRQGGSDDLVALVRGRDFSVLAADGIGGFQQPALAASDSGLGPFTGLLVGNFDADAFPDVIVTAADAHAIHRGRVGGDFLPAMSLGFGGESRSGELVGAAALDLATVIPSGGIGQFELQLREGDGAGAFGAPTMIASFQGYQAHLTGDIVDGFTDEVVVVADNAGGTGTEVSVYRSEGATLVLEQAQLLPTPFDMGFRIDGAVLGDFDGDGQRDDVAMAVASFVLLFLGDGTGLVAMPMPLTGTSGTQSLLAADLTGNNIDDIVLVARTGVAVLEAVGGGVFAVEPTRFSANIDPVAAAAVDLDANGLAELVVSSGSTGDLTVFRNSSVASLQLRISGDADADGNPDWGWAPQPGATWSLLRGDLGQLLTNRDLAMSSPTCLLSSGGVLTYEDEDPLPAPVGDYPPAFYYLLRCESPDCTLGFGMDSMGTVRFMAGGPCP